MLTLSPVSHRVLAVVVAATRPLSPATLARAIASPPDSILTALYGLEARALISWSRANGWVSIKPRGREVFEGRTYRVAG